MKIFTYVSLLFLSVSTYAGELIELRPQTDTEFSPISGELFKLPVMVKAPVEVALKIYTSDGDLVTTIKTKERLQPGNHELVWNGKDDNGIVVPNEAYVPVVIAHKSDGKSETLDPRLTGGGEVIDQLNIQTYPNGDIGYTLPAPARVLTRIGVKEGPMLRSLANWVPQSAGKNVQQWDGFDQEKLSDLRNNPNLSLLVMAYKLPQPIIITYGNNAIDYRSYRLQKTWTESFSQPVDPLLERNGTRISRNYYQARFKDKNPKISLTALTQLETQADSAAVVTSPINLRVDIAAEDRWLMQESLYEVGFFIDNTFISEEEHGYLPFTWQLDPTTLTEGNHLLTINISGLDGKTSAKSFLFHVKKK